MLEEDVIVRRFGPGGRLFHRRFPAPEERIFLAHPPDVLAGGFRRRFRTRAERIAELEAYLRELEAEAQGVRETLDELRGRQQPRSQGQP